MSVVAVIEIVNKELRYLGVRNESAYIKWMSRAKEKEMWHDSQCSYIVQINDSIKSGTQRKCILGGKYDMSFTFR